MPVADAAIFVRVASEVEEMAVIGSHLRVSIVTGLVRYLVSMSVIMWFAIYP